MKANLEPQVLETPMGAAAAATSLPGSAWEREQGADADAGSVSSLALPANLDLLSKVYRDFCSRRAAGEQLDADAYCAQYPHIQSSLTRLLHAQLFGEETITDEPKPRWPLEGENFLDYHLMRELGRGAFARVFLAAEPKLGNRLVAVKISQLDASEAEVLGRIQHPNIVPVHSVHEDRAAGLMAVVMPYAGSATLCDLLDQAQLSARPEAPARVILDVAANVKYPLDPVGRRPTPDATLKTGSYIDGIRLLGAKLADALAYLHDRGICHRDLKPSNVLLSPEGEPLLLDFNLCADIQATLKRLGGTMPYMSPEQLRATAGSAIYAAALDARSDIFALGVILYQLATGQHPFGPMPLKLNTRELREHLVEAHRREIGRASCRERV